MIRPPTGDGFQDYSGVAQSPLADKQQSANVRYSRGDWLQRVVAALSSSLDDASVPVDGGHLPNARAHSGDCLMMN